MFSLDSNPAHDRPFAAVAPLLARWHAVQDARPSQIERAWTRAGFAIVYEDDLHRPHALAIGRASLAMFPTCGASADPVYRAAFLWHTALTWEGEGRRDVLALLGHALAQITAEDVAGADAAA